MELCQHRTGDEGAAERLWRLIATAVRVELVVCLPALATSGRPVLLQRVPGGVNGEVLAADVVQR